MRGFLALLSTAMLSLGHAVTLGAAALAHEPAVVSSLLEQAQSLERSTDDLEGPWQAATRYCDASRLGSTEAQYRR